MKIITSHERADMDALASMYAATLLYPEYRAVLPQKLNRNLREFLSLYADALPFVTRQQLPRRSITDALLVDAQAVAPLRGMDAQTRVHIIDHHDPDPSLGRKNVTHECEPLGATTTLLVERLAAQALSPGRIGATLMLMGIYEDTGSLAYLTTTARDAHAVAWLLEQGADLALANEFLSRPLTNDQREALARLTTSSTIHTVRGRSVCVSAITLERYVDELSTLSHQLVDMFEPDACLLLARHEDSIQIIARSATNAIDVARLLREVGGGGHSKAAAALVKGQDLQEIEVRLLHLLEQQIEPPLQVREIMSTGVHTLGLDISVRDAAQLMKRYGHEGFPVVDGDFLVGILTRRDIDRALHHRLGDMPVRTLIHTGPLHVRPNDPVDEVQRVMIEHNLGQVPVVEDGRFVGIVTRTDVINLWAPQPRVSRAQEIRRLLEETLPKPLRELLVRARDAANDLGYSLYVVGGFVRDLLLGAPNLDLDLVVEGDAIRMARALAAELGARVRSHARFGTAKVILDGDRDAGVPPSLDFVTARTEFYERPTVLPQIESSSIKQDLYRRDFTINTMAICLDRDRYGELLDYYGGERDLRERRIRVLHNLSFVEDPTRILRAVRFEQRLEFTIEARTARLMEDALELLDHVTGERLRHELFLLLQEAEPERALERLAQLGALEHLHPAFTFHHDTAERFRRLRARLERDGLLQHGTAAPGDDGAIPTVSLCYLALLTAEMGAQEVGSLAEHLRLSQHDARLLHQVVSLRLALPQLTADAMLPSAIYHLLSPYSREARLIFGVLIDSPLALQRLELFEHELARVAPRIDGHYLRELGVPPGPVYGEILSRVRNALLDGQVATIEQERELARALAAAAHTALDEGAVAKRG